MVEILRRKRTNNVVFPTNRKPARMSALLGNRNSINIVSFS